MIRREDMNPGMWESMCTPMNLILPPNATTGFGALYLGSWIASVDHDLLQENGIKHIVEVHDAQWVQEKAPGFGLYRVVISDSTTADLKPHLEGVCSEIHQRLKSGVNVLVHCQQGISRSSSIVIAYLIRRQNMTYDTALNLVKEKRMCVQPNTGFEKTLREWEAELRTASPGTLTRNPSYCS